MESQGRDRADLADNLREARFEAEEIFVVLLTAANKRLGPCLSSVLGF